MSRTMIRALILIPLLLLVLIVLFFALRPGPSPAESEAREFDLRIQGDTMTPEEITVGEGDEVTLRITAESPTAFHLHGYDLEREVEPDETAEVSFEADITGRFEVENHSTDTTVGTLIVEPR